MRKIYAYQIAESIDLRQFRRNYMVSEYFANTSEVFFSIDGNRLLHVFSYGVVVFCDYDELQISSFIVFIKPFCKNILTENMWEEFVVIDSAPADKFGFNEASLTRVDLDVMRIVMINVGQSAALDYFSQQAAQLLENTKKHTSELEQSGRLRVGNKQLLKFIGKTLNMKNNIVENLYIIDSPDETWDNEYLTRVDTALKNTFDIKDRFRDLDDQLHIVKENLDLFIDLAQHRRGQMLELIVIGLILFEVIHAFF